MFKKALILVIASMMLVTTVGLAAPSTYAKRYLIIAAEDWWDYGSTNGLNSYLTWLKYKGYHLTLDTVGLWDSKSDVRSIISSWYNSSSSIPQYLLLIGDAPNHNPSAEFDSLCPDGLVESCTDTKIATHGGYPYIYSGNDTLGTTWSDYYYSDIDDDNEPEIAVGRWCPHSNTDLLNIINKQSAYEKTLSSGWTTEEVLFIGTGSYFDVKEDIIGYVLPSTVTCYEEDYTNRTTARTNIISKLNSNGGVSIVNFRGHGNCYGWDVDASDPYDPFEHVTSPRLFSYNDVYNSLTNSSFPPMVFSVNCLSGCITATDHESFIEAWTNDQNGAVGAWGASRHSNTTYNNELDYYLFEGLYEGDGVEDFLDVGWAINYAKKELYDDRGSSALPTIRSYYWIGDPGLVPWHGNPHPALCSLSSGYAPADPNNPQVLSPHLFVTLQVYVNGSWEPVPGASVCGYKADCQFTDVAVTDNDGKATLRCALGSDSLTQVTITKQTINQSTTVLGDSCIFPVDSLFKTDLTQPYTPPGGGGEQCAAEVIKWTVTCSPGVSRGDVQFTYTTPVSGPVSVKIYDATGREVRSLSNDHNSAGCYQLIWDGKSEDNTTLADGVYFFRFEGANYSQRGKITLLR